MPRNKKYLLRATGSILVFSLGLVFILVLETKAAHVDSFTPFNDKITYALLIFILLPSFFLSIINSVKYVTSHNEIAMLESDAAVHLVTPNQDTKEVINKGN